MDGGVARTSRSGGRRWPRLLVAAAALAVVAGAEPKKGPRVTTLARDVPLDGAVVVLDVPPQRDGEWFQLVVQRAADAAVLQVRARGGVHAYDLRQQPAWTGRAELVLTDLPDATGTVRPPTDAEELDAFLVPPVLRPSTVNTLFGHRLFDAPWERVLLILFAAGTVAAGAATRRRGAAAAFGFCLAWAAMDARTAADHAHIVRAHERDGGAMRGLEDEMAFARLAAPAIGDGTWTLEPSFPGRPNAVNYLLGYPFADRRYVPDRADFVVTADPKNRPIVCSYGKFFLVRGPR